MVTWRCSCALVFMLASVVGTGAEEKSLPWQSVVINAQSVPSAPALTEQQLALVRRANEYFNRLSMLEGSFLQTAPNGKQQRGMLHISRPGRFRFEFAPPSRVVIISDGRQISIQDYDLKTDDRQDLRQMPFRALLGANVDLVRDTLLLDVREASGRLLIEFRDENTEAGSVTLFLATRPMQLMGWMVRDNQSLDTWVDLTEIKMVQHIDDRLFDPSSHLERRQW